MRKSHRRNLTRTLKNLRRSCKQPRRASQLWRNNNMKSILYLLVCCVVCVPVEITSSSQCVDCFKLNTSRVCHDTMNTAYCCDNSDTASPCDCDKSKTELHYCPPNTQCGTANGLEYGDTYTSADTSSELKLCNFVFQVRDEGHILVSTKGDATINHI